MSVIRPKPPADPIHYDPSAVFAAGIVDPEALATLSARLDAARDQVLAGIDHRHADGPRDRASVTTSFVDLPDRLLADYGTNRPESELFAMLRTARRIREGVDRVIVLGRDGPVQGIRALVESCCHPFHNELPRGDRGGRPRLSYDGFAMDNDATQGLLDLVAPNGMPRGDDLLDRWAVLVVDANGDALRPAVAARHVLAALWRAVGGERGTFAERIIPVTGGSGRLADLATAIGCPEVFHVPEGVPEPFAVLSAVGVLPASIVGVDVVRLLEGAAAMNRRFREAPVADNPVLQCAGVFHRAAQAGFTPRIGSIESRRLEAVGGWYHHLRGEGMTAHGVPGRGPLTTTIVGGEPRRDRLTVPSMEPWAADEDLLGHLVGTSWSDLPKAAGVGAEEPAATIMLPRLDEHVLGQLLQMLMLATAVEARC